MDTYDIDKHLLSVFLECKQILSIIENTNTEFEQNLIANNVNASAEAVNEILLDTLNGKTFKCKKYRYNVPNEHSNKYDFWGYVSEFEEDNDKTDYDENINTQNLNNENEYQNVIINSVNNSTTKRKKKYSLLLDLILIFCTAGLWIIWMIIRPKCEY